MVSVIVMQLVDLKLIHVHLICFIYLFVIVFIQGNDRIKVTKIKMDEKRAND